jgi:hypothetical protein
VSDVDSFLRWRRGTENLRSPEEIRVLSEAPERGASRYLLAVQLVPEIKLVIEDLIISLATFSFNWCFIGGVTLGVYTRPRTTVDVDFLLLSDSSIHSVARALRSRFSRAGTFYLFTHNRTGVTLDIITPDRVEITKARALKILNTAIRQRYEGARQAVYKVASLEGLIASKVARFLSQDRADIDSLLAAQGLPDMRDWDLTPIEQEHLKQCWERVQRS